MNAELIITAAWFFQLLLPLGLLWHFSKKKPKLLEAIALLIWVMIALSLLSGHLWANLNVVTAALAILIPLVVGAYLLIFFCTTFRNMPLQRK